ncbi:hypothetical protein C0Q70_15156 [Pomacea canaliculata]|uniref:Uncharacterized protein n=1 Tax=Pomacea canaliculata TaxID=400727 RepID=A0A2T7NU34_POMCA|nr:hypothetical protein C0Q70_15156 [Pomacea canaliculata]
MQQDCLESLVLSVSVGQDDSLSVSAKDYNAVAPCKDSCSVAGPVAGTAIGCSVVFFIVGAIFDWWMRRSRSKKPSQADYSHEEFSSKSNLGTPALSSRRLAECPGRPESPKDRSEDTSDYGNIGFDSNIYEESVVSDNKMTAYVPLEFPVNSKNTDNDSDNDYINATSRHKLQLE